MTARAFSLQDFTPETIGRIQCQVEPHVRRTPLIPSDWLTRHAGVSIYLKCENLQRTGSFKLRGAVAALSQLSRSQRLAGVLTSSTGNHGSALAFAALSQGIPCTVVVPPGTPEVKKGKIREFGAELVESPHSGYDATQAWTLELGEESGRTFISPFENPWVVAGNGGTTGLEILEELPRVGEIITPVGGGGLAAGLGLAGRLKQHHSRLVGVNAAACPGMAVSLEEDKPRLVMEGSSTLADAIEGGVGEIPFVLAKEFIHSMRVVREDSIAAAILGLARKERHIVEGAGAVGVAALLEGYVPLDPCVVLLSGGNIEASRLAVLLGATKTS